MWKRFPCSLTSQKKTQGEGQVGAGRWQKDGEGAHRGNGRDEHKKTEGEKKKARHRTGTESRAPKASKVARGEK